MLSLKVDTPDRRFPVPTEQDIQKTFDVLHSAATLTKQGWQRSIINREQLLLDTLILVFADTSAGEVYDLCHATLIPTINGLMEGHETHGHFAASVFGGDAREHLRQLTLDQGDPLQRILKALKAGGA